MSGKRQTRRGFSLVEIMIVIVIIGMLASVVTINVRNHLIRSRQEIARTEISTLVSALNAFWGDYGRYPTNEEGLGILLKPGKRNPEPYIEGSQAPSDPWARPYHYLTNGKTIEVFTLGADGREGGDGADADISSKDLQDRGTRP